VLQFHGCAGARLPFQEMWARRAHAAGFASVIVDSNRPRGMNRETALEQVCGGKTLIGQERAGDILAALDMIGQRDDIDLDRIVLTGWSHGAWSIMDYMTMDLDNERAASLSEPYSKPTPSIAGTVLFYPYCGLGTLTRIRKWQQSPKTLGLIAGADTIVDHQACLTMFDKLRTKHGQTLQYTVYPGTEHAFDDPFIEPPWQHWHNGDNMRDAMARYSAFLDEFVSPSSAL
jgi:dienelactone hydrolase